MDLQLVDLIIAVALTLLAGVSGSALAFLVGLRRGKAAADRAGFIRNSHERSAIYRTGFQDGRNARGL